MVRLPVSIAIVCRDASRTIGRTLDSVAPFAGEVVVHDSGSTDGTLEVLERHAVADRLDLSRGAWLGHVKTKQMVLERCRLAWVLCLDADESVEPDLAASIRVMIEQTGERGPVAAARVNRKVWYAGRFLDHAWQPERRLRLVRRGEAGYLARWGGLDPHDKLEVTDAGGRVVDLAGTLRHDSFETFAEQMGKDGRYARLMAENLAASGVRGSRLRCVTSPAGAFVKQMVLKRAWRDGTAGWLAALATASATLQKHAALLEITRGRGTGGREESAGR